MPATPRAEPVSRRQRPAKPALSRSAIVRAAVELVDRDGLEALTMRRLAQALDTAAGSLYVYVANREELLAAVYDEVLGELELPDPGTVPDWRAALTDLLMAAVALLGRHGGISRISLGTVVTGPHALALGDTVLGLLDRGGVEPRAAAWAVDQLMLYVDAAALEEHTYRARDTTGNLEESVVAGLRETYRALPADRYPHLTRLGPRLTEGDGEQRARWFLTTVLTGLQHS